MKSKSFRHERTAHPTHYGRRASTAIGLIALAAIAGVTGALAKGGTAKPPGGTTGACPSGAPAGSACIMPPAGPVLPNFPAAGAALSGNGSNGFAITGFVQTATVDGGCGAPGSTAGGTVVVNGISIRIPSDTIVQYPANTLGWADAVCGVSNVNPTIGLDGSGGTTATVHPGVEISVDGNITTSAGNSPGPTPAAYIGTPYVAALVHISQHSLNSGAGYITNINYATGDLTVTSAGGQVATLRINDPKGRFGLAQTTTDARFSVDDANPTIKAAATGYPMCVPRAIPPAAGALETDPLCPQKNRPQANCRNFASVGLVLPGGDLPTTPINGYCAAFVMKAVAGMPGTAGLNSTQLANGTGIISPNFSGDPDPREMAPFQIGDFITWSGTLVHPAGGAPSTDIIWVHTIDANVGIYTQPATLPAYIAIGDNGIGVNPAPIAAGGIVGVEGTPRIFMEASVSDVSSIVDIYYDDKGFGLPVGNRVGPLLPDVGPDVNGGSLNTPVGSSSEYFRWITPETMTGTVTDQVAQAARGVAIPSASRAQAAAFGGGIYTQFIGPQPGRARIRANKVPAIDASLACPVTGNTVGGTRGCAVTQSPTRYIRAVLRSLCAPAATGTTSEAGVATLVPSTNLSTAGNPNTGPYFDINGTRAPLIGGAPVQCLESAPFANGLFTGQYMAPVGEYIFPENTLAGFRILPNNFWHLGFMAYGENGRDGNSTAPQVPRPW